VSVNKTVSTYLDLIRIWAAACVFLTHAAKPVFGGAYLNPLFEFSGPAGVVIFFVLSGFVIAWVADTKETDAASFIINRFARLWSVVIPAIILTVALDAVGSRINPTIYQDIPHDQIWYRSSAAILFLNQIWFASVKPMSDGPMWSLCYEFWYYIFFAACQFADGAKRIFLAGAALIIMGPKIAALLPIWLLGVWLYHNHDRFKLPRPVAVVMLVTPVLAWPTLYLSLDAFSFVMSLHSGWRLGPSAGLLYWYPFSLVIAGNIIAAISLKQHLARMLESVSRPIKWAASFTLSFYLYHFPLFLFIAALVKPRSNDDPTRNIGIIAVSVVAIICLGLATEHKKAVWRNVLRNTFYLLGRQTVEHLAIVFRRPA
jgi:peptidoglycan/LPS O-acetylase OafA/YrhL